VNDPDRLPWNTSARVDGTTIVLHVDVAPLRAVLESAGVAILPMPRFPDGKHPVLLDLWHVGSGRIVSPSLDQHDWSASAGAALAAMTGAWRGAVWGSGLGAMRGAAAGAALTRSSGPLAQGWAAAAGWYMGGAFGSMAGAASSAAKEAGAGASAARGWSEGVSEAIGSYDEVLVGVPNAVRQDGDGRPCTYVLGMVSNGPISIWGDRALRCGYKKRGAEIRRDGFDRYEVRQRGGPSALNAVMVAGAASAWGIADVRLKEYRCLFEQPLLGHLGGHRYALTFLDRFLDAEKARWAPAVAEIAIAGGFIEGLPGGFFRADALSPEHPWGAFQTSAVSARLTLPRHVG
jgi:hypothetical protein